MTRDEILQAVIALAEGYKSVKKDIAAANRLHQALPHANIIDLMFQDMRNLTPEQIVDEAINRELEYQKNAKKE